MSCCWNKKSLSFRKALPYSSKDNGSVFRYQSMTVSLLTAGEVTCHLFSYQPGGDQKPLIHFLHAKTRNVKTIILLPKPVDTMAQTFLPLTAKLNQNKCFMACYTSFFDKLRVFFFTIPSPSRYSRSQLMLNLWKAFWRVNRQTAAVLSLVALAHKESHQLRELACRVFMLLVAHA